MKGVVNWVFGKEVVNRVFGKGVKMVFLFAHVVMGEALGDSVRGEVQRKMEVEAILVVWGFQE